MAKKPSETQATRVERSRQVGVSFPVDRMIEEQLADERREKARALERTRPEVYGMPVDTIIESAKQAYPPKDKAPPPPSEVPVWTSIEDQMANPTGRRSGARSPRRR